MVAFALQPGVRAWPVPAQPDAAQRPGTRSSSTFTISTRGGSTTSWRRRARRASATGMVKTAAGRKPSSPPAAIGL